LSILSLRFSGGLRRQTVNKTWQKYLDMASGLTAVTRERAERVVRTLVKQGEVAADNMERTIEDLLKRSEENRRQVARLVRSETERAVARLGLAREKDVQRLENKVERLESKSAGGTAKKAARKAAKKSAAAKRARARTTTAKKTAQRATAKKGVPPAGDTSA
jgi:polyhydroxyalkanoate synthesis regulator phasin